MGEDRVSVFDQVLAIVLVHEGYDLLSLTTSGRRSEYVIRCPQSEFDAIKTDYFAGQWQIGDVRAFARTWFRVVNILAQARRSGQPWINELADEVVPGRG